MIKANELRIGNWVYPNDENATPYQVKGIIPGVVGRFIDFGQNLLDKERVQIHERDLFPIDLTPEILGNCGFVYDSELEGHHFVAGNNQEILIEPDGTFYIKGNFETFWIDIYQKITSLHQLQNTIFVLTGDELNYTP